MHRRVIIEHFDPPKTSGLWLVVEHFYGLKQILYIAFNRDTFVFLNENLGNVTFIVEKQHLHHLSVGIMPYVINGLLSSLLNHT